MTNQQVIEQVVADPVVIGAHTVVGAGGVPRPPTPAYLRGLVDAELQNEMNSFLNRPAIKRALRERDVTLTLSDGTSVTQGVTFTLSDFVGSVINVTTGTSLRPLHKWRTREEFDRWYYENIGQSSSTDIAHGWLEWGRSATGQLVILIAPGTGSDSTANVHYVRRLTQPVDIQVLPDELHYVIVTGTKNRASGGKYEYSYQREISDVLAQLQPMIGGVSRMRLPEKVRKTNWRISNMISGVSDSSSSPWFISRTQ